MRAQHVGSISGGEEAVFDLKLTTRRPDRGRCRACTAANIPLPAWYARRADTIEGDLPAAAGTAMSWTCETGPFMPLGGCTCRPHDVRSMA